MKDHIQQFGLFAALVLGIVCSGQAQAQVYKTVDENGNVIYTDSPPNPDSKPMDLPGLSVIAPQVLPKSARDVAREAAQAGNGAEGEEEELSIRELRNGYRDFTLVSPTPEQTFVGTDNEAVIAWDTRYALRQGMSVTIYIDGEPREPTTSPLLNVVRLDRGEHQVYAELRDSRNRRIATTETVTFFIRQNSILSPTQRAQGG